MKLLISAVTKMLAGLILVGLLLFLSAGTLSYNGAWAVYCPAFYTRFNSWCSAIFKGARPASKKA